jgi:predicted permease
MERSLWVLAAPALGLAAGAAARRLAGTRRGGLAAHLARAERSGQRLALLGLFPAASLLAFWGLGRFEPGLFVLPFLGAVLALAGWSAARAVSRALGHKAASAGAFACCGLMAETRGAGAVCCLAVLGEAGFAAAMAYGLFEEAVYYPAGFGYPRRLASGEQGPVPWRETAALAARAARDPYVLAGAAAILAGGLLNAAGAPRPGLAGAAAPWLAALGSFLLMFQPWPGTPSSGQAFPWREAAATVSIRCCLLPGLALALAAILGGGAALGPAPVKALVIMAAMPVGGAALVPATLYGLDAGLARACRASSLAALAAWLPVLALVMGLAR